jgi:hypothetical protein
MKCPICKGDVPEEISLDNHFLLDHVAQPIQGDLASIGLTLQAIAKRLENIERKTK